MASNDFKLGERVAVYSSRGRKTGTIQKFASDGFPMVQEDGPYGGYMAWHPKQCRRLKPKKRREFWMNVYPNGTAYAYKTKHDAGNAEEHGGETILVREVRNDSHSTQKL